MYKHEWLSLINSPKSSPFARPHVSRAQKYLSSWNFSNLDLTIACTKRVHCQVLNLSILRWPPLGYITHGLATQGYRKVSDKREPAISDYCTMKNPAIECQMLV